MNVELPNGVVVSDVPDDISQAKLMSIAIKNGLATAQDFYDPTEGMSGLDKFVVGIGKGMTDLGHGIGQMVGLSDAEKIAEKQRIDAKLMESGAAKAGEITGKFAAAAPALFVPGANTLTGAALTGGLLGLSEPVSGDSVLEDKVKNGVLGAAFGAGGYKAGNMLADKIGGYLTGKEATRQALKAANAVQDDGLQKGMSLGYKVNPTQSNPTLKNQVLEGISGKIKTQQAAAEHNQYVTNQVAKKTLGLPDDAQLTPETLAGVRKEAGKAYQAIKGGDRPIKADAQYLDDLARVVGDNNAVAADFPSLANKHLDDIVAEISKEEFKPASALAAIRMLRDKADSAFRSGEGGLGRSFKKGAEAIESLVERNLKASGDEAAYKAFTEARKQIAKSYSIEKALNPGSGNVVSSKLASQLKAGKPLSGELKDAAQFAASHPRATQEITSSMPGISPLDFYAGAGIGAGTGEPTTMLLPAMRPALRKMLLSEMYQKANVLPNYAPSALENVLLGSPDALRMASRPSGLLGFAAPSVGAP